MITNRLYSLHYISGIPYLLPCGQLIADHFRGMKLNDTGIFIWNRYAAGDTNIDEITQACMSAFSIPDSDYNDIRADVKAFTNELVANHVLIDADTSVPCFMTAGADSVPKQCKTDSADSVPKQCKADGTDSVPEHCKADGTDSVPDQCKADGANSVPEHCKADDADSVPEHCKADGTNSSAGRCNTTDADSCPDFGIYDSHDITYEIHRRSKDIFLNSKNDTAESDMQLHLLEIAGIKLSISGPEGTYAPEFIPFESSADSFASDISISIYTDCDSSEPHGSPASKLPDYPDSPAPVPVILNRELKIYEAGQYYSFDFPSSKKINSAIMSKDGTKISIFCDKPDEYDIKNDDDIYKKMREHKEYIRNDASEGISSIFPEAPVPRLKDDIFHAIRLFFLYGAHRKGMLMLHSSSILYRDRAWLFSASSGIGKSTHTGLWHSLFGTPVLNGDLNLFTFRDEVPVIMGTPWCGTSGICDPGTYRLGGIIMLKRAVHDYTELLAPDSQRLLILQRLISPAWNELQIKLSLNIIDRTADSVLCCRLNCTKNENAAICMKERIDHYLTEGTYNGHNTNLN